MPPVPRGKQLRAILNYMRVVRDNLIKAETAGRLDGWHTELRGLRIAHSQLVSLAEDTSDAAEGYVTVKKVRQALWMAARELESAETFIDELIGEGQAFTQLDTSVLNKWNSKLNGVIFSLKRLSFAPPVPRPKPTVADLARNELAETSTTEQAYRDSNLNNSTAPQAGKLGDQQLGALDDFLKNG